MSTKQVATRDQIIKGLTDMCDPNAFLRYSEDFDGNDGGIWTGGEGNPSIDGIGIFDYWNGNNTNVDKYLEDNGWFAEWYDAGTMFLWEI